MIDITFATMLAYDYNYSDADKVIISCAMHGVAGEPGSFRFTAHGYRVFSGKFVGTFFERVVDVHPDNVRDMETAVDLLLTAADECILTSFKSFDVVYDVCDANGTRWHPMRGIGRSILAEAFEREGVDCYPLTMDDVKAVAAR